MAGSECVGITSRSVPRLDSTPLFLFWIVSPSWHPINVAVLPQLLSLCLQASGYFAGHLCVVQPSTRLGFVVVEPQRASSYSAAEPDTDSTLRRVGFTSTASLRTSKTTE